MIISVPFWVISIAITAIKIILSGTIGAIFAFYAYYSNDFFANSIRWSRIGGFFEMVTLFRNSHEKVPTKSRIALVLMILATTFNDTRRNPNSSPTTRYTPRTYGYETACNESAAYLGNFIEGLVHPPLPLKCKMTAAIISNATYDWNPQTAFVHFISSSVVLVAAPTRYSEPSLYGVPRPVFGGIERHGCLRAFHPNFDMIPLRFPNDGIINLPRTDATKCQYGSNESLSMAATYIDFAVNRLDDFDSVTTSIFEDASDIALLKSMSAAIKNGTFPIPSNTSTMAVIAKITSDVDYLICISQKKVDTNDYTSLLCTYMATALISIKPQPWDEVMTEGLDLTSVLSAETNTTISQLDLTIFHLPKATTAKRSPNSFSTTHLLKATTDAAEYLTSLGHNVFVNSSGRTKSEGLYILYDTVKLEDAFEIPTVALFVLLTVVVVCAIAWVISEMFYDPVYNDSLYKVIFQEIRSKEETTPMLMTCARDPLTFEGNQVVPLNEGEQPDGPSTSQDVPLLLIDKTPIPHPSTQQTAPLLEEIPAQSPLLISRRLFTSIPTITSVSVATNTNNQYLPETASRLSSQPTCPAIPPPIPPRPPLPFQESGVTFGPFVPPSTSIQKSHPRASNQSTQAPQPQSPPPNEKSTLIQNPFCPPALEKCINGNNAFPFTQNLMKF
ncbi:hypothetical protein BG015_008019 [Linnemannia schmuckeri]|uniref:Uncharacterized protein n=1 Tax=Linnemannia schmuckeri TaxID=64567 RepID=A0A9P5RXL6_9FUNG|nr:hypothetical protein BG015_008019 [Linnemannia schmuckeri]